MEPLGPSGDVVVGTPTSSAPPPPPPPLPPAPPLRPAPRSPLLPPTHPMPGSTIAVTSALPQFAPSPDPSTPGHRPATIPQVVLRSMFVWRLATAAAIAALFVMSGLQVQRILEGRTRSGLLVTGSVVAGIVAAIALLVWTYSATENARRLVAPATTADPPDPRRAMATWAPMFVFLTAAAAVVVVLSSELNTPQEDPSSVPLAIAVMSILIAVPLAFWPFQYLSRVVRQIGGRSADLGRWMWVPVMLAVVGAATVAGLRAGGAVDSSDELAPMWVVAIVAIAPCIIVLLLGWRAGESVEEAVAFAAKRRSGPHHDATPAGKGRTVTGQRRRVRPGAEVRGEISQVPGSDALRFAIVTALAGLALLSTVGAAVMVLFWMDTRDSIVLPSQRDRAGDTLDALRDAARWVGIVTVALASLWTFVAVLNVRMATGRRRNPVLAAVAWPAACVGVWILAGHLDRDSTVERILLSFAAQAAVLYVPFFLLERVADSAGARRTPIRMSYVYAVVLLVYAQGLVTLSDSTETATSFEFGRLAGYLGLGSVVLLLSTLAVTEACRSIGNAAKYESEHHNGLVEQRRLVEQRAGLHAEASSG